MLRVGFRPQGLGFRFKVGESHGKEEGNQNGNWDCMVRVLGYRNLCCSHGSVVVPNVRVPAIALMNAN